MAFFNSESTTKSCNYCIFCWIFLWKCLLFVKAGRISSCTTFLYVYVLMQWVETGKKIVTFLTVVGYFYFWNTLLLGNVINGVEFRHCRGIERLNLVNGHNWRSLRMPSNRSSSLFSTFFTSAFCIAIERRGSNIERTAA